jgi:hypothetical protein
MDKLSLMSPPSHVRCLLGPFSYACPVCRSATGDHVWIAGQSRRLMIGLVRRSIVGAVVAGILGIPGWELGAQPLWREGPPAARAVAFASDLGELGDRSRRQADPVRTVTDSVADSARLATITTDTGAFAPGEQDFTRYDTPALCLVAARHLHDLAQRSLAVKLARQAHHDVDTMGAGRTAVVVRRCGAHFTLAGATPADLSVLFDLALFEQDDTLAQAVVAREVAQAATPAQRHAIWARAYRDYGWHDRLAAAAALLAQVDALGASARSLQMRLHFSHLFVAKDLDDTVGVRQEIARVLALVQAARDPQDDPTALGVAIKTLELQMAINALAFPDSLPVIATQASKILSRWTGEDQNCPADMRWCGTSWGTLTQQQMLDTLAPAWTAFRWKPANARVPRLQADFWFPPPGRASSDMVWPVPGKVNLICLGAQVTGDDDKNFGTGIGSTGGSDFVTNFVQAIHIRHWLARYGAAGLEVTIVHRMQGAPGKGVTDWQNGVWTQPSADGARWWQWAEQVYNQLPVTVAVQVQHLDGWLPAPDGRWVHQDTIQFLQDILRTNLALSQFPEINKNCAVIDRDGTILYRIGQDNEEVKGFSGVDDILTWLFKGSGAVVSAH